MKVEYLKTFSQDLDVLKSKTIKARLLKTIMLIEETHSLKGISNLKKHKGNKSAYRIRIGDYCLGLFFENSTILIARFVHRKDIYKTFP